MELLIYINHDGVDQDIDPFAIGIKHTWM